MEPQSSFRRYALPALLVVLALVLVYVLARRGCGKAREGFVSQKAQEIHDRALPVYEAQGDNASHSAIKAATGVDAVTHQDMKALRRAGRFSPEGVQQVIG